MGHEHFLNSTGRHKYFLNSTGRHEHFLNSTGRHWGFLNSTCKLRTSRQGPPQSDGSLAIVDIDASKGFVDLCVHFFVAIVDIHQNGYRRKVLFFGFD